MVLGLIFVGFLRMQLTYFPRYESSKLAGKLVKSALSQQMLTVSVDDSLGLVRAWRSLESVPADTLQGKTACPLDVPTDVSIQLAGNAITTPHIPRAAAPPCTFYHLNNQRPHRMAGVAAIIADLRK